MSVGGPVGGAVHELLETDVLPDALLFVEARRDGVFIHGLAVAHVGRPLPEHNVKIICVNKLI